MREGVLFIGRISVSFQARRPECLMRGGSRLDPWSGQHDLHYALLRDTKVRDEYAPACVANCKLLAHKGVRRNCWDKADAWRDLGSL